MSLPAVERARRYTARIPAAVSGQGGHDATFHVAMVLVHGFALTGDDTLMLLREWNRGCQPEWSERELRHKVESALAAKSTQPRGYLLGPGEKGGPVCALTVRQEEPAPPADPAAEAGRFLKGFRCAEAELMEASPVKLDGDPKGDGGLLVEALYRPGELINFVTEYREATDQAGAVKAQPMGRGLTLERGEIVTRFAAHGSDTSKAGGWLRMNPVDGKGIGDANVRGFRFALLESDSLTAELQLTLFAKLPLPIACLISSGGRSVHAWVVVDAPDANEYRATVGRMLGILTRFGVDGKNKNPSRLSRLPGARREIGAVGDGVQRLLYLNPQPAERGILC